MTDFTEIKERLRKMRAPAGKRTQKVTSFRLDLDLVKWLDEQPNKGRYINNLIRADMNNNQVTEV